MAPGGRDVERAALSLTGDAGAIAAQLTEALPAAHGFSAARYQAWRQQLADKVRPLKPCLVGLCLPPYYTFFQKNILFLIKVQMPE